jgi:hypothetical protein
VFVSIAEEWHKCGEHFTITGLKFVVFFRDCWNDEIKDEEKGRSFRVLKNAVFWDVTPCGSCRNRRFGGT